MRKTMIALGLVSSVLAAQVAQAQPMPGMDEVFSHLPGVSFGELPGAGLFPYYSHPEQLAGLLTF